VPVVAGLNDGITESSEVLLDLLEMVGTMAFSLSGAVAARRARMDWFGVVVLGVAVAIGGGTLRDLLIGHQPVSWIEDGWPVPLAAAATLPTMHTWLHQAVTQRRTVRRTVLLADAVGLATFSVVGADVGLRAGLSPWVAVVLGVITAVFGGIFRDILVNERPAVLTGEVYALASAIGATLYVVLAEAGLVPWLATWIAVVLALGLRVLVLRRGWSTPPVGG
jgi:uncharacterized membrane protein YeiH